MDDNITIPYTNMLGYAHMCKILVKLVLCKKTEFTTDHFNFYKVTYIRTLFVY